MLTALILGLCTGTNDLYLCYDYMMYCLDTTTYHRDNLDSRIEHCSENIPPELYEISK